MIKKLDDIKRYLRDIKFSIIFDDNQITIKNDLKILDDSIPLFFGRNSKKLKNKYISQIRELDGILTGSAALNMYYINGVKIFNREPNDLDFLISRDNFMKFCGMNNFKNVKYTNNIVSLDFYTGIDRGENSYGSHRGYYFHTDFDVIGTDDEVKYELVGDLKIGNLIDIINYKLYLIDKYMSQKSSLLRRVKDDIEKHLDDLFQIVTTISANENKKT